MRLSKACAWLLPCLLVACGPDMDLSDEQLGMIVQADTEWVDGTYARFLDSGRMYSTHPYEELIYLHVIAAAAGSNWHMENPERFQVMVDAMNEARVGLCGDAARSRYGARNDWCSEYARWNLLQSGLKDIRYCTLRTGRAQTCAAELSLSDVTKTAQMVQLFSHFGAFTPDSAMTKTSVHPGDYLAMTGNSGRYHHSGIVLGYSGDYRWIWTVEGNYNDCVVPVLRPFFTNGVLNPDIDGVGNIDILF